MIQLKWELSIKCDKCGDIIKKGYNLYEDIVAFDMEVEDIIKHNDWELEDNNVLCNKCLKEEELLNG